MPAGRKSKSEGTCTTLISQSEQQYAGASVPRRRAKRKRTSRSGAGQRTLLWSNSTSALASMAAFLLIPHCYNNCYIYNNNGPSILTVRAADDDGGGSDERDPQTDLWLAAEGDINKSKNNNFDNNNIPLTSEKEESSPVSKKKEPPSEEDHIPHRSMEEELQLHAEHQHNSQARIDKERYINAKEQQQYQQFMDWCQKVLGIQTSLEIHTFYYYDYMTAIMTYPEPSDADGDDDDDDNFDFEPTPSAPATTTTITPSFSSPPTKTTESSSSSSSSSSSPWQDPPMIPVRGLRATRNITQGEVIISIPFQALLTVSTTIDQDPVLSRVMGKEARQAYGWTLGQDSTETGTDKDPESSKKDVDFFELPLLAMALLHHYKLGTSSPLYPYIHLLRKSPLDQMPFLWSKQKRQKHYTEGATTTVKGIQTVARSIRLEMKDMYQTVVLQLLRDHPEVFGRGQKQQYDTLDEEEWAFSFENFQWAFAMVNSRHWLLPIVDLEQQHPSGSNVPAMGSTNSPSASSSQTIQPQGSVDGVPPAETPTDAWVHQEEEGEEERSDDPPRSNNNNYIAPTYHSFLAPVADLLNFGPPCTRGRYNQETHTFDIVASCDFFPGQEVTFWYSDECEEIIVGNYGFSHPMVPKCPTIEDFRVARDKWKQRAASFQEALEDAYEDMDVMDTELQHIQHILANCDCCDTARARHYHPQEHAQQQHQQQQQTQQEHRPPHKQQQQKEKQSQQVDGWNGNYYLRNPHDGSPRQIRGGRGTMMSRSSGRSNDRNNNQRRSNHSESRRPRGGQQSRSSSDDDVERHGIRRMWAAGRSAL